MEKPKEKDFYSNDDIDPRFKENLFKGSLNIEACPIVTDPRAYIKEFLGRMIEREKKLGNPDPEFNNFWKEPKDHLTLLNDFMLKDIKEVGIEKSFDAHIKLFDCRSDEFLKVVKKYKSVKFFYTWLEAFKIVEKAFLDDVLNGNNKLREKGITHLEVYFMIGKNKLKIDAERFPKNSMPGHELKLQIGIDYADSCLIHNRNTIAFSKKDEVKVDSAPVQYNLRDEDEDEDEDDIYPRFGSPIDRETGLAIFDH